MAKNESALAVIDSTEFRAVAVIGTAPGALQEMIRENIGTDLTAYDLPRLKVPAGGGSFWEEQTAEGPKPAEYVDGVILLRKDKKKFWEKGQDEAGSEATPPDCSSEDRIFGQGNPGGECAKCPYNEFGTAKKGGGKACRDFSELYILKKNSVMPTVVQIPATSLKNLKQYGMILVDSAKNMSAVVTRFYLTVEMKSGSKTAIVNFKSAGDVPEDMKGFIKEYQASLRSLLESQMAMSDPAGSAPLETDGEAPFSA
jgi:hypothetical protein